MKLDISKITDIEQAAKTLHEWLVELAKKEGFNPEDVRLFTPEESEKLTGSKAWRIMWEGGPNNFNHGGGWATDLTLYYKVDGHDVIFENKTWYLEQYYEFDVLFYPIVPLKIPN